MRELVVLMVLMMASPEDAPTDQAAVASPSPLAAETLPATVRDAHAATAATAAGTRTASATLGLDAPR